MQIEHIAPWTHDLEGLRDFVDKLTSELCADGFPVLDGPR
jgi:hypothetical protein